MPKTSTRAARIPLLGVYVGEVVPCDDNSGPEAEKPYGESFQLRRSVILQAFFFFLITETKRHIIVGFSMAQNGT